MHFEMNTIDFSDLFPAPAGVGRAGWGCGWAGPTLRLNFMESPLLDDPVLRLIRRSQLNHTEVPRKGKSWASEGVRDCLEGSVS